MPFNQTFSANGGAGPYTYALTAGALPAGLSLSSGVLKGTPGATGTFSFDVRATDSTTPTPLTTLKSYSFTIAHPTLSITGDTLPQATVTAPYSHTFSTTGGTAPYVYSMQSGSLAPGLSLSSSGVLSGTPSAGGSYTFSLKSMDSTGGGGPYADAKDFTIVATLPRAPDAPTIGTATAGNASASVSFTPPVNNGGSSITSYTAVSTPGNFTGNGPTSPITIPGLSNGTPYTFTVFATSALGSSSASQASNTITPNAAPEITSISPTAGPVFGGTSVTITGRNFAGTTAVTFGSASATGFTVNSATQITATAPAGAGTVDIRVTTAGGTSSTSAADQFTYIPQPSVSSVSPNRGPVAGGTNVTINGSGFSSATSVTFGAASASSFTVNSATQIIATAPAGTGTVDIRVTTAGGTSSTNAADQFTYFNLTAGAVSATVAYNSSANPIAPNAVDGTVTSLAIASPPAHGTATTSGLSMTYTPTAGYSGADSFTYTVSNGSSSSAPATITVTVPPPTLKATASGTWSAISDQAYSQTLSWSGGAEPYSNYTVTGLPAGLSITGTTSNSMTIYGTPAQQAGPFNVVVGATDSSTGNGPFTTQIPFSLYVSVAVPTVSSISPSSGTLSGGTAVTITGTGFAGANSVQFGGIPASSFTVNSATQITATAPAHPGAGTVNITVRTAGGTSAINAADQFTYIAVPAISSVSPPNGPAAGGTSVTITGSGFDGATAVRFGGTNASSYTVNSPTQITATAPTGTGTVDITVITAGGTSTAGQFTYIAVPAISSVSPSNGPAAGGTSVTITGSGFDGATAVRFGGASASSYTVNSPTQITATAPAGTGTVSIVVTTPGGTSNTGAANQFTYIAVPVITSLSPSRGPAKGGTAVIITGSDLSGATAVNFGGASASAYTVNSATQITATAPAGTGPVDVTVTTPSGTSNTGTASQFTYINLVIGPTNATVAYGSSANPITLNISGDVPTSVAVASSPAHGTATASGINITYTPTAGYSGPDSFTYTATNGSDTSAPATVSLTVSPPTQTITPSASWTATSGQPYSQTLSWNGGTAPYANYTATGLPAGLSVTTTATNSLTISGTPTQAGSFSVAVSATDSSTGAGPFPQKGSFTLIVGAAPTLTLTPGASTLTSNYGSAFSQAFSASGGVAPYRYVQTGSLPTGLSWNAATATLSGEPAQSGSFAFTITATDSSTGLPSTATQNYTLQVADEIPVAPPLSINSAGPGQPVELNLTDSATGGPFTAAKVISVSPASAGSASIREVGAGQQSARALSRSQRTVGKGYILRFVPNPDASGIATLSYTLSNASSTSSPGVINIALSSRGDPSKDAEVLGLINAQANSSRRFANGQISNFQQRLEALHAGNVSPFTNGLSLTSASLQRNRLNDDDPTGIEQWLQIKNAKLQAEPSLRSNPASEQMPALGNQPENAPTSPLAFWTSGTISIGDDSGRSSDSDQTFVTSGLSVGADYRWAPNLTLGVGFGYGHDKTDIGDNGSRSQADSYSLALYGSYRPTESTYLDAVLGYQRLTFDTRRYVTDNAGQVNGSRNGNQTFASLAAGYEYRQEQWMLSPYARLDLAHAKLDSYRERGDDIFALSYDQQTVKTTSTSLGLRGEYAQSTAFGNLSPSLRLEYQHDFQGAGDAAMRYADLGGGTQYHIKLDPIGQDRGVLGLGLGLLTETNWSLRMEYQFTISSGSQQSQSVLFNVGKPF